ncbi:MAG: recombinase family protein [Rubrobacter sp.]|nr:recombinase family protein [Rubrobacter sp.]
MASTNGHGPKQAILYVILYARVSTDEQARSGYSLAQQMEALRQYAAREGYEVLEEVTDPGQSGASLERPGMDRVRDLVAAGGVSLVLAQDRDRFAREPAYHYLLRKEFEEHGTTIRALNGRGDDSPEGELTDGILDQLGKYQRAKTMEMTRRGKLQKVREGKVIAGRMSRYDGAARYGYRFNEARDALVVDEEKMSVVRRIFRMVGVEAAPIYAVKRALDAEGVPTATGKGKWAPSVIRDIIMGDVYLEHSYDEVVTVVLPGVAAKLNPEESHGLWEWGAARRSRTRVSELTSEGRIYKTRQKRTPKPKSERIYVPIPSSGVPREWVEAAREAIKDNRRTSNAGRRFWELSGGILRCGECGWTMHAHTAPPVEGVYKHFYYVCKAKYKKGPEFCTATRTRKAEEREQLVWAEVRAYLEEPERLRADLDRAVELERGGAGRGDPGREAKVWAEKIAEADAKRARFQHAYAEGVMGLEDLRERLAELEEEKATADRELAALRDREARVRDLERDRDAVLDGLVGDASDALDCMTPEQRHHFYKILRLKVRLFADDSMEITGVFPEPLGSGPGGICTLYGSSTT